MTFIPSQLLVKSGTPVDNQVAIWTGNGTIEGAAGLTYDATTGLALTKDLVLGETGNAGHIHLADGAGGAGVELDASADTLTIGATVDALGLISAGKATLGGTALSATHTLDSNGAYYLIGANEAAGTGSGRTANLAKIASIRCVTYVGDGTSTNHFSMINAYCDTSSSSYLIIGGGEGGSHAATSIAFYITSAGLTNTAYGTEAIEITYPTIAIAEEFDFTFGTTYGSKFGKSTSQKIGWWNATPVVQPTAVADATDAASVITQLNALLARLRTIGLIAT